MAVQKTHHLEHQLHARGWPVHLTPYYGYDDRSHLRLWRQRRWRWFLFARRHPYSYAWRGQAECIHTHESVDWHDPGSPGGGMQFMESTWLSAGGSRYASWPQYAQPWQQLVVAFGRWRADGGSWREWSTAPLCGLA